MAAQGCLCSPGYDDLSTLAAARILVVCLMDVLADLLKLDRHRSPEAKKVAGQHASQIAELQTLTGRSLWQTHANTTLFCLRLRHNFCGPKLGFSST